MSDTDTIWIPQIVEELPVRPRLLATVMMIAVLIASLLVITLASGVLFVVIHNWYYFSH